MYDDPDSSSYDGKKDTERPSQEPFPKATIVFVVLVAVGAMLVPSVVNAVIGVAG